MADLDALVTSWLRDLRGRNLSPRTVTTYAGAMRRLIDGISGDPTTDALRGYFGEAAATRKPGGVSVDWRAVQQFFKWAEAEGEITPNPMARMRPPVVPEPETRVLRLEEVRSLLKVCEGRDFASRRDMAMLSLFLDTGMRRAELAGLLVETVDIDRRECAVIGKGRRGRIVTFGARTARALDRYERVRNFHRWADLPAWWLAERGRALTAWGVDSVVNRRGREAGMPWLHAHVLRHTWAHNIKSVLPEDEIMRLAGWRSQQMLSRYAASTADERARESGKRSALLDRL